MIDIPHRGLQIWNNRQFSKGKDNISRLVISVGVDVIGVSQQCPSLQALLLCNTFTFFLRSDAPNINLLPKHTNQVKPRSENMKSNKKKKWSPKQKRKYYSEDLKAYHSCLLSSRVGGRARLRAGRGHREEEEKDKSKNHGPWHHVLLWAMASLGN